MPIPMNILRVNMLRMNTLRRNTLRGLPLLVVAVTVCLFAAPLFAACRRYRGLYQVSGRSVSFNGFAWHAPAGGPQVPDA